MKRILIFLSCLLALSSACSTIPASSAPQEQSAPSGSVLFQDDFSDPSSGFNHFMGAEGIMDYDSGGYRILVNAQQTNFWATPRKNFTDVRLEVDSGKLGGPDENRIGLLCRYSNSNYYFFIITSDGFYGVGIYYDGKAALIGQSELQASENIKKGVAINHLRADCVGNTLTFYINGALITSVQDAILKSGDVGLLAGAFAQPGVDIVFDNFVVVKP